MLTQRCVVHNSPDTFLVLPTPSSSTDCVRYGFGLIDNLTVPRCIECPQGKVLVADWQQAASQCITLDVSVENCEVAVDATTCFECADNFILINGLCVDKDGPDVAGANCLTIDSEKSRLSPSVVCKSCSPGKVMEDSVCVELTDDNACIRQDSDSNCASCATGYVLFGSGSNARCLRVLNSDSIPVPGTDHDPHCEFLDQTAFQNGLLSCRKCKDGHFPVHTDETAATHPTFCYSFAALSDPKCSSYNVPSDFLKVAAQPPCTACSDVSLYTLDSDACRDRNLNNIDTTVCSLFAIDKDECRVCNVLSVDIPTCTPPTVIPVVEPPVVPSQSSLKSFFSPNIPAYIESCSTPIQDCDSGTTYHGLGFPANQVFSCHKCQSEGYIPFAFVRASTGLTADAAPFGEVIGPGSYQFIDLDLEHTPGNFEGGHANRCLPHDFKFHPGYAKTGFYQLPEHCALAFVHVLGGFDTTASNGQSLDRSKLSIACTVCKPGFSPTFMTESSTTIDHLVAQCTAIPHCESSQTFNLCDACQSGFAFSIDQDMKVDMTACHSFGDPNCFIFNDEGCLVCRSGFYTNLDLTCEPLILPNCQSSSGHWHLRSLEGVDTNFALAYASLTGCHDACDSGTTPVVKMSPSVLCLDRLTALDSGEKSKFTQNCLKYKASIESDGTVKCSTCMPGFILVPSAGVCITFSDVNCIEASLTGLCSKCQENSLLISGSCFVMDIAKCQAYSTANNRLECTECLAGYFLKENKCVSGPVANCATYSSPLICSKCLPDFILLLDLKKAQKCLHFSEANCSEFDETAYVDFKISCKACKFGFKLTTPSASNQQDRCLPFGPNNNCDQYEVGSQYAQSSFRCLKCKSGHYYSPDEDFCKPRLASLPSTCILDPISDSCLPQKVNPVRPTEDPVVPKTMDDQPKGETNCDTYDSLLQCTRCHPDYFLLNNKCIWRNETSVEGCDGYDGKQQCFSCVEGLVLSAGQCQTPTEDPCLMFNPLNHQCLKCREGFTLKGYFGEWSCQPQEVVDGCIRYSDLYPFECVECHSAKVPSKDNQCVSPVKAVDNCIAYTANDRCSSCKTGYSLRVTGEANECFPTSDVPASVNNDPNCDSFRSQSDGNCEICKPGQILRGSRCINCKAGVGCAVCDYADDSKCLLCTSSYSQETPGGICRLPLIVPPKVEVDKAKSLKKGVFFALANLKRR